MKKFDREALTKQFQLLKERFPPKSMASVGSSVISPLDSTIQAPGDMTISSTTVANLDSFIDDSKEASKLGDESMAQDEQESKDGDKKAVVGKKQEQEAKVPSSSGEAPSQISPGGSKKETADHDKGKPDKEVQKKERGKPKAKKQETPAKVQQKIKFGKKQRDRKLGETSPSVEAPIKTSRGGSTMDWEAVDKHRYVKKEESFSGGSECNNEVSGGSKTTESGDDSKSTSTETSSDSSEKESDDAMEEDCIKSLKSLTVGKAFIELPLRLKVVKVDGPSDRPGAPDVCNIEVEDMEGVKVRMPLWSNEHRLYKETFEDVVGQEIFLSGVRLQVMGPKSMPFAPDSTFKNELKVYTELRVKPLIPKQEKPFDSLKDLKDVGMIGGVTGHVQVKIGKKLPAISYNSRSFNTFIVHDGKKRMTLFFTTDVDLHGVRKGKEMVINKLRIRRSQPSDIASTVCFVQSNDDFECIRTRFNAIDQPKNVCDLPELFNVEKVVARGGGKKGTK